jgi:hypothetical protein
VNRLKSLPWNQILLVLILIGVIANYLELRSIEDTVDGIYSDVHHIKLKIDFM